MSALPLLLLPLVVGRVCRIKILEILGSSFTTDTSNVVRNDLLILTLYAHYHLFFMLLCLKWHTIPINIHVVVTCIFHLQRMCTPRVPSSISSMASDDCSTSTNASRIRGQHLLGVILSSIFLCQVAECPRP